MTWFSVQCVLSLPGRCVTDHQEIDPSGVRQIATFQSGLPLFVILAYLDVSAFCLSATFDKQGAWVQKCSKHMLCHTAMR